MNELVLIANSQDGTISTLRLVGGRLEQLATSPVGLGVDNFAVDPERGLVFAAVAAEAEAPAQVLTLELDRESGTLSQLHSHAVEDQMTYLSLTEDRRFLLGASYGGGCGAIWPVDAEGVLGESRGRVAYPNLHCVVSGDVGGQAVAYFVSLGADLVAQFRIGADGALEALGEVRLPAGCGPRHLIVEEAHAYLVTEYSGEVLHLRRDRQGLLSVVGSVSIADPTAGLQRSWMGADFEGEPMIAGADLHRAGNFLLASERKASTLAVVPVGADGALGEAIGFSTVVEKPRGFNVSADGGWVIVAGERSPEVELLGMNDNGTLRREDRAAVGRGANWVRLLSQ